MKKTLTLTEQKEVRTGISAKTGNPWTLWEYMAEGDPTRYKSFKDFGSAIGKPFMFQIEEEESTTINKKTGKPFVNYTIKDYATGPKDGGTVANQTGPIVLQVTRTEFDALTKQVENVATRLANLELGDLPPSDEDMANLHVREEDR